LTVRSLLDELRQGTRLRGRNDEDKLTLLEARTVGRVGETAAAAGLYETLLDHPVFGEEAKQHLAGAAAS
jgi:hypothetical protein